ncbi:hypothetical protein B0T24DRAFT_662382 [Lasiosphaeria ovina]|uniref:Uncharacterized protein n=1 Tax=Lasiosphaeria ovina TaxID=92902 RepID=A0AAE0TYA1_9PEZI|nr:hypothetical protein B0T24DRAFT_662382 [Lasiosphaeria ovina]
MDTQFHILTRVPDLRCSQDTYVVRQGGSVGSVVSVVCVFVCVPAGVVRFLATTSMDGPESARSDPHQGYDPKRGGARARRPSSQASARSQTAEISLPPLRQQPQIYTQIATDNTHLAAPTLGAAKARHNGFWRLDFWGAFRGTCPSQIAVVSQLAQTCRPVNGWLCGRENFSRSLLDDSAPQIRRSIPSPCLSSILSSGSALRDSMPRGCCQHQNVRECNPAMPDEENEGNTTAVREERLISSCRFARWRQRLRPYGRVTNPCLNALVRRQFLVVSPHGSKCRSPVPSSDPSKFPHTRQDEAQPHRRQRRRWEEFPNDSTGDQN